MSSLRYKTLLSYLPGMASVVNTFESSQVQNAVYETLMEALEAKLEVEGIGSPTASPTASPKPRELKRTTPTSLSTPASGIDVVHDLVEGDSIHGDSIRSSITASTVF